MAPVFVVFRLKFFFLVKQLSYICWHRGVPSFVGVMLRTPGLRCYAILCVAFPLIAFIN